MIVHWKFFFWILIEFHLADYEYNNKNIYNNCFDQFAKSIFPPFWSNEAWNCEPASAQSATPATPSSKSPNMTFVRVVTHQMVDR